MNDHVSGIASWFSESAAAMSNELEQLCDLNSGSENVEGLTQTAEWLRNYFAALQVQPEQIELPSYAVLDDSASSTARVTGPALRWNLGCKPDQAAVRILLSIHYDTVYGSESGFQTCTRFQARNGFGELEDRMRGPGVIDAKGGIVVMRWTALAASKFLLNREGSRMSLSIILTPDEEIGSPASIHLWKKVAQEFDLAMLFEPALPDGSLVSHRKGTGTFTFVVRGKSAHSGRNFADGRNAIVHASKLAADLHSLNGERPDVTINIGRIRGGDAVNVVPDLVVLRVNVRIASQEDQRWIEDQAKKIAQRYDLPESGYRVELHGGIQAAPKVLDEATQSLMKQAEEAATDLNQRIQWKLSGGASDGNKLSALGLPSIDTFGPEGDLLHSHEEWIRLGSLPSKALLAFQFLTKVESQAFATK